MPRYHFVVSKEDVGGLKPPSPVDFLNPLGRRRVDHKLTLDFNGKMDFHQGTYFRGGDIPVFTLKRSGWSFIYQRETSVPKGMAVKSNAYLNKLHLGDLRSGTPHIESSESEDLRFDFSELNREIGVKKLRELEKLRDPETRREAIIGCLDDNSDTTHRLRWFGMSPGTLETLIDLQADAVDKISDQFEDYLSDKLADVEVRTYNFISEARKTIGRFHAVNGANAGGLKVIPAPFLIRRFVGLHTISTKIRNSVTGTVDVNEYLFRKSRGYLDALDRHAEQPFPGVYFTKFDRGFMNKHRALVGDRRLVDLIDASFEIVKRRHSGPAKEKKFKVPFDGGNVNVGVGRYKGKVLGKPSWGFTSISA